MTPEQIARVVHEANRAVQIEQDDPTIPVSPPWDETDPETRQSAVDGVRGVQQGNTPEESHDNWTQFKVSHGWTLGPVKDEAKKEHPLLVPYDELPASQRIKDSLFVNIVRALTGRTVAGGAITRDSATAPEHDEVGWAYGVIYDDLGNCGCGYVEDRLAIVRQLLRDCPLYEGERWRAYDSPLAEWLLCVVDSAELIEHGSSISGSWITEKGARFLAVLEDGAAWRSLTKDDPPASYCQHCLS